METLKETGASTEVQVGTVFLSVLEPPVVALIFDMLPHSNPSRGSGKKTQTAFAYTASYPLPPRGGPRPPTDRMFIPNISFSRLLKGFFVTGAPEILLP
jgi:hypothetical protein